MSDVTPEELRALADRTIARDEMFAHIVRMQSALRAAADALQAAEADRDALARKIAAADHSIACEFRRSIDPRARDWVCTCWKSQADTGDAAHQGQDGAKGGKDE